jgi:methylenetetrahydrofolate dehydrogenase (NADP+)/methenyltetrahydrofolate cyclohydrolase
MIVDGKAIAASIYGEVAEGVRALPQQPVMAAITCAPNFETQKYLELKKRKAAEVGIALRVVELPEAVSTEEAIACVLAVAPQVDGVVVQLPFPKHVDREALLASVSVEKDPDGFAYGTADDACVPPVTGAILAIAKTYGVNFLGKDIVVLGAGRLVGAPAAHFLRASGATVTVLTDVDFDEAVVRKADIIITGIGKPHFVTPDMVKEGVIVFDAGTSEDGGVVVGDVHPDVARVAALFTPVPGGIGPITIAVLLQNLLSLVRPPQ